MDIGIDKFIKLIDFIFAQDFWCLFAMLLPFIMIEVPRYVLSDITILIMTWLFRDTNKQKIKDKLLNNPPLISVIVPGHNEEKTILRTIKSIQEQTYTNIEIIVVDDGSDDRTYEVCLPLARTGGIKLLRNRIRGGKSSAINHALNFCRGEYIVVVDADSSFDRDAMLNLLVPFANPKVGGVSGNIVVRNARASLITVLQALEYRMSIG
jgi:cellulose synthase/poly-beta-1,6-N-acetylglucosamine synthase-like glycosyltransferase